MNARVGPVTLGPATEVVIGSRDVDRQITFLRHAFQFDVLGRGPDEAVVGVPGVSVGVIRVERAREGYVQPPPTGWELGPRLLSIRSRDLARSYELFERVGGEAGPIVQYEPSTFAGTMASAGSNSEFVGLGPDDVMWAVAKDLGDPSPALAGDADRLNTEVWSVVVVVDSTDRWRTMFGGAGGMRIMYDFEQDGEAIERVLALPKGARLRFLMYADADYRPMRIELMEFPNLRSGEQRERQIGITEIVFEVDHVRRAVDALVRAGAPQVGPDAVLGPEGLVLRLRSHVDGPVRRGDARYA